MLPLKQNPSKPCCTVAVFTFGNWIHRVDADCSLSVRPSHGWISQKWSKLGLWNFHHPVDPFLWCCGISFIQTREFPATARLPCFLYANIVILFLVTCDRVAEHTQQLVKLSYRIVSWLVSARNWQAGDVVLGTWSYGRRDIALPC